MPLYAEIYRRTAAPLRQLSREQRHTNSCMYGLVSQKLDATKVIQSYWRQGLERLCFHRLSACFLRDALAQQRLSGGMNCWAQIISGLATCALFLMGARFVLNGAMTLGQMLYLYGIAATLFSPVLQLTMLSVQFNHLLVIVRRLVEVLDEEPEIVDKPDAVPFPKPIKQGITLNHVGFRYGVDAEAEPVLQTVSIKIPAGTWLCIMGPSGSGKSTLLYLLARLFEPTWGEILIDGIPLPKIKINSLRNRVSFVPQEPKIFSGTIRDNICYGFPGAEPREIMNAAKAAELHKFIMDLPVKYETMMGEKGVSLSGGQRQRLSLARALLTDPDLLLLDDCTSSLDADTERRIQDTLAKTLVGKTAIIVSQRVSMAKRCHGICTIENGIVSEFGTHDELAQKGGFYARLYAQQSGTG
jgi:ABC-type multidrug transport system fused ATPase/permease subunit